MCTFNDVMDALVEAPPSTYSRHTKLNRKSEKLVVFLKGSKRKQAELQKKEPALWNYFVTI